MRIAEDTVLRVLRQKRKLSQTDLGFLVGMTQATISYIETCRLRASSDQMGKLSWRANFLVACSRMNSSIGSGISARSDQAS